MAIKYLSRYMRSRSYECWHGQTLRGGKNITVVLSPELEGGLLSKLDKGSVREDLVADPLFSLWAFLMSTFLNSMNPDS